MKKEIKDSKNKKSEVEKIKSRQIRLLIIAVSALLIFALLLSLAFFFFGSRGEDKNSTPVKEYNSAQLKDYIRDNWDEYEYVSYDPETGILSIKGSLDYTYEKAEKYGAAVFDDDYLSSYVYLVQQIAIGVSVDCNVDGCTVTLDQYSTDGQIIYSVDSNGEITACWDEAASK